jgi:hypothetical protein
MLPAYSLPGAVADQINQCDKLLQCDGVVLHCLPKGTRVRINVELMSEELAKAC